PETTIHFSLKDAGRVKIEIFNIKGEKIRTLVNEYKNVGFHSTIWNGKDNIGKTVASGMYFYSMISEKYHKIRKMLLIK
ncbi:MAG: T9SS type A sorting domain-containing protein, partial [Candidatus Cloacimonetes bacterium]|nr:T9SS type A sorting domain-containing protein [Candidatus Cloacimonadota bacterium]